ncbi:MAG: TolC family protein [Planctomycetota bacterium]
MRKTLGVLVGILLTLGCSSQPKIPPAAETPPPPSRSGTTHEEQKTSPEAPTALKDEQLDDRGDGLAKSLTLQRCIALALLQNPEVRSAKLLASAMRHRIRQASSFEDPTVMSVIGTEAGDSETMVGFSQKIPFPGKLSLRGKVAEEDANAAERLAQGVERRVLADVKKTYYNIYVAHKTIEVTKQNHILLESLAKLAEVQYEAGRGTKPDYLRAQVELSKLDDQLIRSEQELGTAEAKMNMLLSRPVNAPLSAPEDFKATEVDVQIGAMLEIASQSRPELLALTHVVRREEANKSLSILNFFPDPMVGFQYMINEEMWEVTVATNVPLWYDRLTEGVREAKDMLAKSHADYEQQKNLTFFEVKDAIVRVKTSERLVRLFRDTVIPQAKETFESSQSSYEVGKVDFLTVLDNWRGVLDFELELYRAQSGLEQNFAELERAIGADLTPQGQIKPSGGATHER